MLANLRQHVTSVLSHVELRVQPAPPAYAMAGAEPHEAMAEGPRTTRTARPAGARPENPRPPGAAGRPAAPQPRTQRRGNGADRGGPRLAGPAAPWART